MNRLSTSLLIAVLFLAGCQESGEEEQWYAGLAALGGFRDNADGTFTDSTTGLTWPKCVIGQTFNATFANCQGTGGGTVFGAIPYAYCELEEGCTGGNLEANAGPAFNACANLSYNGITGWRLPTRFELAQLTENFSFSSITYILPDSPDDKPHWTSSQKEDNPAAAYAIRFNESSFGTVIERSKTSIGYVRCVK